MTTAQSTSDIPNAQAALPEYARDNAAVVLHDRERERILLGATACRRSCSVELGWFEERRIVTGGAATLKAQPQTTRAKVGILKIP